MCVVVSRFVRLLVGGRTNFLVVLVIHPIMVRGSGQRSGRRREVGGDGGYPARGGVRCELWELVELVMAMYALFLFCA